MSVLAAKSRFFFNLRGVPILNQLCFEELLLRTTEANCVVVNSKIDSNSIVLGFSGKPLELLHVEKVKRDNLQVLRRFTGGGTVIVDASTVFASLIFNSADVGCQPYPREIMQWTQDNVYGPVFHRLVAAGPGSSPSQFQLLENDYVWGDRKVGGNAQTITKGRWVHHTSFLWQFDPSMMGYLKMPSKRPAYRAERSHLDFLAEIGSLLPAARRDPQHFSGALHDAVRDYFSGRAGADAQRTAAAATAAAEVSTDAILVKFFGARSAPAEAIGRAEFDALHLELIAANPQFVPRTYIVDDLPSEAI